MAVAGSVRRGGWLLLLAGLLLLMGEGMGLVPWGANGGAGADGAAAPTGGARSATVPVQTGIVAATPVPPTPAASDPSQDREDASAAAALVRPTTAPTIEPSVAIGPEVPAAPGGGAATHDDRGKARRALVEAALADGRLGAASAAFDRLARSDEAVATAALRATVERQIDAGCKQLALLLQQSALLDARAHLDALLVPRTERAVAAVTAMCSERGWPQLAVDTPATAASAPRAVAAAPLVLRDRTVRMLGDGDAAPVRVRVVAEAAGTLTVRRVGRDGVTFPTVPAFAVEPEAVTADESVELGLLAVANGDLPWARLWCASAQARGGAATARLQELLLAVATG